MVQPWYIGAFMPPCMLVTWKNGNTTSWLLSALPPNQNVFASSVCITL
jgi:hypothetical protein